MRYLALLFPALLAAQSVVVPAGSFTMGRTKTTSDDATKMRPQILQVRFVFGLGVHIGVPAYSAASRSGGSVSSSFA